MNKIPSFTINHEKLLRGIYVSRKDEVGNEVVTSLTGNYLLLRGDLEPKDIVPLMQRTFRFIADFEGEIPGAAPRDCGNYLLHDLPMARWEARKFLDEVLMKMTDTNMVYPQ